MADRYPDRLALDAQGEVLTYGALRDEALAISDAVRAHGDAHPFVAVFDQRGRTAYAAILGILAAGKAYVPLNPKFPAERTRRMLALSKCTAVVTSGELLSSLKEILRAPTFEEASPLSTVILPPGVAALNERQDGYRLLMGNRARSGSVAEVAPQQPAYLLFTSGSTGVPKGIAVSHGNVGAYLEYVSKRYVPLPSDRFSQLFDLTFDLSVHDMFVCWNAGACLCVPRSESLMAPGYFIRQERVTMWFSVPSTATFMSRLGMLKPGAFPTLRVSLFCGESLPACAAIAWQKSAPNSLLENLYGPTEATIAITHYQWKSRTSVDECENGLVPIGSVFSTQDYLVVTEGGRRAEVGETGELYLTGSQITGGYLEEHEKTAMQFVTLGNDRRIWYRTGDVVREDEKGLLQYLSRTDLQIKLRGFRVELAEIEHTVRQFSEAAYVVAVPWPIREGHPEGLILAVHGGIRTAAEILSHCQDQLPDYMIPNLVRFLETVPLNSNGKIDRTSVRNILVGN